MLFPFLKKQEPLSASQSVSAYDIEKIKTTFKSLRFVYRDTDLTEETQRRYTVGLMFREPTFCDSTHKFGGIIGNTRFLIASPSVVSLNGLSANPEWGIMVFNTNQIFKVLDVVTRQEKTQITLLHIPDEFLGFFQTQQSAAFENLVVRHTQADFQEAVLTEPLAELDTEAWKERTRNPVGMNSDNAFFELDRSAKA